MQIFIDANHSRLPVYTDTLDDPIGMVHVKDLMRWMSDRAGKKRRKAAKTNGVSKPIQEMALSEEALSETIRSAKMVRELLFRARRPCRPATC